MKAKYKKRDLKLRIRKIAYRLDGYKMSTLEVKKVYNELRRLGQYFDDIQVQTCVEVCLNGCL
ncbi:hypothetical protein N2W52_002081 [Clostridium perfringens]|nr:hypothetical protein [Clostridium perfringens]MDK0983099.1 hypothetical protein [Clostridium perfringens]